MAGPRLILRNAIPSDVPDMADVERQSWPQGMAATTTQCRDRIIAFAAGQCVAEHDGRVIGLATAQRISHEFLAANGRTYQSLTDRGHFSQSHQPNGEIYQLIGVGVLPEFQGQQLGRTLVDRQIQFARSLAGVTRILGFTRPALYHRYQPMPISEYVVRRDSDGTLTDPVLAFHLDAGAKLVAIHPGFRCEDQAACGFGVLIEYPA